MFSSFIIGASLPSSVVGVKPTPTTVPTFPLRKPISAEKLMALVNDWRVSQGFQTYTENELACSFASKRLKEIKSDFSHDAFYKEVPEFFPPHTYVAENLIKGYSNERTALNVWLKSPDHRENLDANYEYSCMRCQNDYCVQIFVNF